MSATFNKVDKNSREEYMEKFFKLKEHGTNIRTECFAGLTTFFGMAYIIFANPNILSQSGMDFTAVMLATCLAAALGCFLTAFLANVPFAQAPGMGLNAFFAFTVCGAMGYSWEQALAIVFISGLIFLAIMISPLRGGIINAIPPALKKALGAGMGIYMALIGLKNGQIIAVNGNAFDLAFAAGNKTALVAILGIIVVTILLVYKVKGAIFISVIATTLIGIPFGVTTVPSTLTFKGLSLAPTFGKVFTEGFQGLLSLGVLPLVTAILTFTIVDMFDTVGTLIGTAGNAGMLDKDGNLPHGDKALIADAVATSAGAILGTSTVTTFLVSAVGIKEGGRTGLTSAVVGLLFLVALLFAPVAQMVPSAAIAPVLFIVGVMMMKSVVEIDWNDFEVAIPSFVTIVMMPFADSIADGIGLGFIIYAIIKLVRGKGKEVPWLVYLISALFILLYVLSLF